MPSISNKRKKNQHYVFQAFLKSWSANGKIWCLRDGQVFLSNLKGVACERFFYRSLPLTEEEIDFVSKVMIDVKGTPETLRDVLQTFLDVYCSGHRMKNAPKPSEWTIEQDQLLEVIIENGAEDWLSRIEDDFLPFLKQMLEGNTAFYGELETAMPFILGLSVQYTRTKQIREGALRVIGPEVQGRNTLHLLSVVAHLMAIRAAYYLSVDREQFKIQIIENHSGTPFITTDQPMINIHGDADPHSPPPERLEFFYPLSPNRAMVFLEKGSEVPLNVGAIAVNNYNVMLAQRSHEHIFSDSEEYLREFAKIIDGVGSGNRLRSW